MIYLFLLFLSMASLTAGVKRPSTQISSSLSSSFTASTSNPPPYPHLAKPNPTLQIKLNKAKARRKRASTNADIEAITSCMHRVEPKSSSTTDSLVKKCYLCSTSANRFVSSTKGGKKKKYGVLFGTVKEEKLQGKDTIAKKEEVARVQFIYETSGGAVPDFEDGELKKVLKLAEKLGVRPVGWIFSYSKDKGDGDGDDNEDFVPMDSHAVVNSAKLQIKLMQMLGNEIGSRFVAIACNAESGATEVFQISDHFVQMVWEGVLVEGKKEGEGGNNKFCKATVPVVVGNGSEAKENTQVEAVLGLTNLGLLAGKGDCVGTIGGGLRLKIKKKERKYLRSLLEGEGGKDDGTFLKDVAEFRLCYVLWEGMEGGDELVELVNKSRRGLFGGRGKIGGGLRRKLLQFLDE